MESERRLLISFSGGETSALMAKLVLENWRDRYDKVVTIFANTGQENEATLEFVKRCDYLWDLAVVWVEVITDPSKGIGGLASVVDFSSADRSGAVFESVIAKYGLPGPGYPHCTRELKTQPITSYLRSLGWEKGSYDTAIGIRSDEIDRMSPFAASNRILYPLISEFPRTKPMINEFWSRQNFRLELKGYQGNCKWCWKKSLRKHLTIMSETPEAYDFPERMERVYQLAGANKTGEPRRLFREHRTVADIRALARLPFEPASDDAREYQIDLLGFLDADVDACGSESCEVDFAVG